MNKIFIILYLLTVAIISFGENVNTRNNFQSFCSFINEPTDNLLDFLNNSNIKHNNKLIQELVHPSWSICLLTRITKEISEYGAFSYFIQSYFAWTHGYYISPLRPGSDLNDYEYYPKLSYLIELSQSSEIPCDYLVWLDADLIPLNLTFRFEELILQYPKADLIVSKDVSTNINTGSIVIRNSLWVRKLLFDWIKMKDAPGVINDQTGFDVLLENSSKYKSYLQSKIIILEENVLNSKAPVMNTLAETDNFIHLAAESNLLRKEVFFTAANQICNFLPVVLPRITISQVALLEMVNQIYGKKSDELENILNVGLIQNLDESLLNILREYRTVKSRWIHSQIYNSLIPVETLATLKERKKAAQLVRNYLLKSFPELFEEKSYESLESGSFFTYQGKEGTIFLPEILKINAELSYELLLAYLDFISRGEAQLQISNNEIEIIELSGFIESCLEILKQVVHPKYQMTVQIMMKDFQQTIQK